MERRPLVFWATYEWPHPKCRMQNFETMPALLGMHYGHSAPSPSMAGVDVVPVQGNNGQKEQDFYICVRSGVLRAVGHRRVLSSANATPLWRIDSSFQVSKPGYTRSFDTRVPAVRILAWLLVDSGLFRSTARIRRLSRPSCPILRFLVWKTELLGNPYC